MTTVGRDDDRIRMRARDHRRRFGERTACVVRRADLAAEIARDLPLTIECHVDTEIDRQQRSIVANDVLRRVEGILTSRSCLPY